MIARPVSVILVVVGTALAQGSIGGRVYDAETKEPLVSVNVILQDIDVGTTTDGEGRYEMEGVPRGHYAIVFSAVGYDRYETLIEVRKGKVELTVTLNSIVLKMEPVTILSERMSLVGGAANLFRVPGSAMRISKRELDKHDYGDIHRILRQVPGVNIQEEDGFGLRPNIGMRGTGVERSRKITLMEDGVLIAPAPYSAPSAYYFPTIGRMETIEIRKGSSQIQYGPNTNGGALNMVSTSIPDDFSASAKLVGGSFGRQKTDINVGGSAGSFGFLAETYLDKSQGFKRLEGGGDTGYHKRDYLAKFRYRTPADFPIPMLIELKWNRTVELSYETYLGLSGDEFHSNPYKRYRASQRDKMSAVHHQVQLSHVMQPSKDFDITTTWYKNDFSRNWYKLDNVGGESIGLILSDPVNHGRSYKLLSAADSDSDEYEVKANNRGYESSGLQSVGGLRMGLGNVTHDFEFGIRFHQDYEDRFQWIDKYQMVNGKLKQTYAAVEGSADNCRNLARATSLFFQDEIDVSNLTLTVGIRSESIEYSKKNWGTNDLNRRGNGKPERTRAGVLLPGVGLYYKLSPSLSLLGGIYRGFTAPGPRKEKEEYEPEVSMNKEIGLRYRKGFSQFQSIAFLNHYDNLLGEDLLAVGGEGTGDQYNAGEVDVYGLEVLGLSSWSLGKFRVPISASYSYTEAEFRNSFRSDYQPWGTVERGDELPYLPNHQAHLNIGFESSNWSTSVTTQFTDAMRTRASQGDMDPRESTDQYLVFDLSAKVTVNEFGQLFMSVLNITGETYVVARRPAGLRPGVPRTVLGGIKFEF